MLKLERLAVYVCQVMKHIWKDTTTSEASF